MSPEGEVSSLFTFAERLLNPGCRAASSAPAPPPQSAPASPKRRERGHRGGGLGEDAFRMSMPPDLVPAVLDVVIVGAGQAGLALAARLKMMGVSSVLVLEKHARVGDNWRKRYSSLCLHDPRNACSMPFIPMPSTYPKFVPKDDVATYLEDYARLLELPVRLGTEVVKGGAVYDSVQGRWSIQVATTSASRQESTIQSKHFVIASGLSGFPQIPRLPGSASFEGTVLHSSQFTGLEVSKAAVILGSNTSAHDIAQALHSAGSAVTMIQRR